MEYRSVKLALMFVALVLAAFLFQGSRPLWETDEGRYTMVASEMISYRDLVVPRLHHEHEHFTKPPLTYWIIAGSLSLFGHNEWAVRVPYAVAFVCTVLAVFGLGRRFTPDRPWLPALIYATSFLPFAASNVVSTDTILTLWETVAVLSFAGYWWSADAREKRRWTYLMWFALALAFMTKGPPGLLPLLAILAFSILAGNRAALSGAFSLGGLTLFAVCGVTWYLLVIYQNPQLLHYFVVDEVVDRVATDKFHRHGEWYGAIEVYAPVILCGTLPWTFYMFRGLPKAYRKLRNFWQREERVRQQENFFLACWLLIPLVIFFVARSRLTLYLLPLMAPLALMLARNFPYPAFTNRLRGLIAAWAVLLLIVKGAVSYVPVNRDVTPMARAIRETVPFHPSEVIFLDDRPRYGLGFYLDCEVERVAMDVPIVDQCEDLNTELSEPEDGRLFLIASARMPNFEHFVKERGFETVVYGQYGPRVMVAIRHVDRASPANTKSG